MNCFRMPRVAPEKQIHPLPGNAFFGVVRGDDVTTYSDLLRDPRWQKVRLKKLESAEWKCECCMDGETTLSVHHKRYVKGRMPWEYEDAELAVLCQPCHEEEHESKELRSLLLSRLDVDGPLSTDDFFAFGAGAMPEHMADAVLRAVFAQIQNKKPRQFASGQFVRNLEQFGIGAAGFVQLAKFLDSETWNETFFNDLMDVFAKHKVPLIGGESVDA